MIEQFVSVLCWNFAILFSQWGCGRKSVGLKRADKKRMEELKVEHILFIVIYRWEHALFI